MTYNEIYKQDNVWGEEPNPLLKSIWGKLKKNTHFLDLGCGQGRDSIFMWHQGFLVTAVDISAVGLQQIPAKIGDVPNLNLICAKIEDFNIEKNKYSAINLFNSLQFIQKTNSLTILQEIKNNILPNGYIIISCFLTTDSLFSFPQNKTKCFFEPQELKEIFSDFEIIFYEEKEIDDQGHAGQPLPHKHSLVQLIAKK